MALALDDPEATQAGPSPGAAQTATRPQTIESEYEILEELGRGAMAIVYRARERRLNRIVALKVPLGGSFMRESEKQRFLIEARAAARLNHPNIVAVYGWGEHGGRPYFSMELVSGRSLAARAKDSPSTPHEAASLVRTIAQAIAYAHSKDVIHRDLKPANILVEENGQPKVADFGLAKELDVGDAPTLTGQVLGTPAYLSPEQALGDTPKVGKASDIYGLGAVLYFLLAGRAPFQGASIPELLQRVTLEEAKPVRSDRPTIPRDLEIICLKCLEKEPAKRYASANDLGGYAQ